MLSAAAALIVLINTAYQDGREDNLPPAALRAAVRIAAVLLTPLILIALWGLSLRIGQHGLTPDRIIASACALVGVLYAAGYGWAARSPLWRKSAWMKPLERTNVLAAVLTVLVILALFSPLADPARLSVNDQMGRLKRGAVSAVQFDYAFLRFGAGKTGRAALADLAKSSDAEIARRAKAAQASTSRYDVEEAALPARAPNIAPWPADKPLPAAFLAPTTPPDPRYVCNSEDNCLAAQRDLNGDGRDEILLATAYNIALFAQDAEGRWVHQGDYQVPHCPGPGRRDLREALKHPDLKAAASPWPDLNMGAVTGRLQPETVCPKPVAVNP
ncbi:hypothetical protein D3C73_985300 [compost metagenome]